MKREQGFKRMSRDRQREVSRKGGIASHAGGRGHEWTSGEAREAGRKGALARWGRKK